MIISDPPSFLIPISSSHRLLRLPPNRLLKRHHHSPFHSHSHSHSHGLPHLPSTGLYSRKMKMNKQGTTWNQENTMVDQVPPGVHPPPPPPLTPTPSPSPSPHPHHRLHPTGQTHLPSSPSPSPIYGPSSGIYPHQAPRGWWKVAHRPSHRLQHRPLRQETSGGGWLG